jgi:hypothetical protein
MAQPIWITETGSLGTIPEGVFYQTQVSAFDPDEDPVYFALVAGSLPNGIALSTTGSVEGVPFAVINIQGVPADVSIDVTSKFCIRAYTTKIVNSQTVVDRFADRTFTITVAGQNIPIFITPAGSIGSTFDAGYYQFQIEFTDNDQTDTVRASIIAGSLPQGLTISASGLISGFIPPIEDSSEIYNFTVGITDGKSSNLREFSLTVEQSAIIKPYIANFTPSNIGTFLSDSFFAFRFLGADFEDEPIEYIEYVGAGLSFPPGTTLNSSTGWLSGYIPDLGITELVFNFAIQVQRVGDPSTLSNPYYFSVNINGSISSQIIWISPENLGTINTGDTSTFRVEAVSAAGLSLYYRFKENDYPTVNSGIYNKLPQGLKLLSSGNIVGRVSFDTFSLDNGSTTFDVNTNNSFIEAPTTFDLTYRFTINAYSLNGVVNVFKTFVIRVNRAYNEPYQNLYIQAMPGIDDRAIIESILTDTTVFVPDAIYRPDDPNFGVADNVKYWHAYGLRASTVDEYLASLNLNHYWKNLLLGPVKTARALNANGDILYEVVYSEIIDDLVNRLGQSVSKFLTLPYPIATYTAGILSTLENLNWEDAEPTIVYTNIETVYPNSLINMRDQVIDQIGKISEYLPTWMISKQENGQILGYTPAWVICYTNPGQSKRIAYYFNNTYPDTLNKIDFKADRYELDRLLSRNWDPVADSTQGAWVPPASATTFDLLNHYRVTSVVNAGSLYQINDEILILGSNLGGTDGLNDVVIRVLDVDNLGAITYYSVTGTAPLLSTGDTYNNITGTTDGSGINAEFDFIVASGSATIFDDNSMRFITPLDNYSNSTEYDKYLIFPKSNILA